MIWFNKAQLKCYLLARLEAKRHSHAAMFSYTFGNVGLQCIWWS